MVNLPDPIPESLIHNQFFFQILHPDLVELDYQAVMSSKDYLRRWSQSEWPTDDFSLDENLTDLEWHFEEQVKRIAFTYSILDPYKTTCLGCIYLKPVHMIKMNQSAEIKLLSNFSHFCSYWVIDKIRGTQQEALILSAIINWLTSCWQMESFFLTSNPFIPETDNFFRKNGMELFLVLDQPNRYQHCWKLK